MTADLPLKVTAVEERHVTAAGDTLAVWRFDSGAPGPTVAAVAGIHGNEVAGIVAMQRLARAALPLRAGRLVILPICNPSAHGANSRVSPVDGLNLARVFPGDPSGEPTEQLAAVIVEQVMVGSDVFVDLHTSSPQADLPFIAGCLDDGVSPECRLAVDLCHAFGSGVVWTHPTIEGGVTLTTAHELAIPAIYVESPRGGMLPAELLREYSEGLLRILARLGMLEEGLVGPGRPTELWLHGNGFLDVSPSAAIDGYFVPHLGLLAEVAPGDLIGVVVDAQGEEVERHLAPVAGRIMMLRTEAIVKPGDGLYEIAQERARAET